MAAGNYQPIVPFDLEYVREGTVEGKEAASQTFKKGAPLVLNTGLLEEAGTAPATIIGFAAEDATGTTSAKCHYWPAKAGVKYQVVLDDALAQAQIGANYGIVKDPTTGYWYLLAADTGDQFTIKAFDPRYAIGDTKAVVYATVDAANIAGA
jgi:hypothetical protein